MLLPRDSHEAIQLVTFDGSASTTRDWLFKKDPVMGGSSQGSFRAINATGILDGVVGLMPIIRWPSFVKAETQDTDKKFPDVSKCHAIALTVRSLKPYTGYHFSFGNRRPVPFKPTYGYKARFEPPVGSAFGRVAIPFENFTSAWNDETGDPVQTCQEDSRNCPDLLTLRDMKTVGLWAEGVAGDVHLEVRGIEATSCVTHT